MATLAQDLPASGPPSVASISFGETNWLDLFVVDLNANGTVTAHWWNSHTWILNQTPMLNPASSTYKFSYIAMNMDMRFYGMTAGRMLEFSIDYSNPFNWNFVGSSKQAIQPLTDETVLAPVPSMPYRNSRGFPPTHSLTTCHFSALTVNVENRRSTQRPHLQNARKNLKDWQCRLVPWNFTKHSNVLQSLLKSASSSTVF